MIESLYLINFQSHEDSLLEFHPGTNVILGSSDSGKSSILRALNWAIANKPNGDGFIRHGAKECKVAIQVAGAPCITRSKGKQNSYTVGTLTLEAFGQGVPDEVSEWLNINSLNIQNQHDSPFLLSVTPGEAARFLNKAINLDSIDLALSNIQSEYKTAIGEHTLQKKTKDQLEQELVAYNFLDDIETAFRDIEVKGNILADIQQSVGELKTLTDGVIRVERELDSIKDQSSLIPLIEDISLSLGGVTSVRSSKAFLSGILMEIKQIEEEIKNTSFIILTLERQYKDDFPSICPLCEQSIE